MITVFHYPHELDLSGIPQREEFNFIYNPELEEVLPGVNTLANQLLARCEGFEFTELHTSPWMTVTQGPVDGYGWHNEGIRPDDYSLVYALNDSDGGLEIKDKLFEHKRGRAVVFESNMMHRVQRVESGTRFALAFLMHRRKNG